MENLLFAAPQRKHATKRKKSKKGKVRIIRITTIKYRVFRKTLRKKKKSKIFPTHVWFKGGSEKDYYIKGAINQQRLGIDPGNIDSYEKQLDKIAIGKSVTSIDEAAFANNEFLDIVTIPDSVKSIGEGAFAGCFSLDELTIPASVTSIGDYIFDRCEAIDSVTFLGMTVDQVKAIYNRFNLRTGVVVHCTDGDFTT